MHLLRLQGELLDGDNAVECSQCNDKRATLKRSCIARLPNTLVLHLKRFDFDLESMRKLKVSQAAMIQLETLWSSACVRMRRVVWSVPDPVRTHAYGMISVLH